MQTLNNTQEDRALLEALSPVVNELIDNNYEHSKDKIASQMAPLMGNAIREQIKSQKDDVVDALYPVIGNMISKYVSKSLEETLNSINEQIQNGLSFKAIKRKIKARSMGVSETQLLLEENTTSYIRAILLIHKDTGVVLAEAQEPNTPLSEPEMIASMISAIRSFVNDWIEKNDKHSEVAEINYGSSKIVIENSGYCYLAVVVDGATYNKTIEKIRTALEKIVTSHGEDIRNFKGNLSEFPNMEIYQKIAILLNTKDLVHKKKKKIHPIIYLIPILLIAFGIWNWYEQSQNESLYKSVNEAIYKTPQLTTYRIVGQTHSANVTLEGEVPFEYHKSLAQKIVQGIDGVKSVDNKLIVVQGIDDPMQISSNISYLIRGLNVQNGINLTYDFKYPVLNIYGTTWDLTRKDTVLKEFQDIKGVKNIINSIVVSPPKNKITVLFNIGSYGINKEQEHELLEYSKLLNQLDENLVVDIKGYSDSVGSLEGRKRIASQRAQTIANTLKENFSVKQKMIVSGQDTFPNGVDIKKDADKARCSIITIKNTEK